MADLEVWRRSACERFEIAGDRCTIGRDPSNDVALEGESTASRLHAVIQRYSGGWSVSDLGSSNGTYLNGERLLGSSPVRDGDTLRIGQVRLVFRNRSEVRRTATVAERPAPQLTPRERDVLVVLCRPLLDRDLFTEPATVREIAAELVVSEAAVKQHLTNLFTKFEIAEQLPHRRARLANEALRSGSVTLTDLPRREP